MRPASIKQPLLSVDVDICNLYVAMYVDVRIFEAK